MIVKRHKFPEMKRCDCKEEIHDVKGIYKHNFEMKKVSYLSILKVNVIEIDVAIA